MDHRSTGSARHTVDGVVIGVECARATRLEFRGSGGVDSDGVGAEEGVHMTLAVLSREDDGINVLHHEPVSGGNRVSVNRTQGG